MLQQSYVPEWKAEKKSMVTRFLSWCESQEDNRLAWLAGILAVHGCVLAPITVLLIVSGSNSMVLWAMAIGAMGMAVISNLAALPTRFTIPIFFFSIVIDLAAVGLSFTTIV